MRAYPAPLAVSFPEYVRGRWQDLLQLTLQHAGLVLSAMAIATVIGIGLGVATYRSTRASAITLSVCGVFLTIPSFALFTMLIGIPVLGVGFRSALVALVLYALLPIVRNTIVGLREVDPAVVESAQGMGMSRWQRLRRIELPLAWPIVITGVRVSTVIIIGIAAIGAVINAPGLGKNIFRGLARLGSVNALNLTLSGTLGIVLLSLVADVLFLLIRRFTTSRGIR
jgi:osmoprotectant transport system permease protein